MRDVQTGHARDGRLGGTGAIHRDGEFRRLADSNRRRFERGGNARLGGIKRQRQGRAAKEEDKMLHESYQSLVG